MSLSVSVPDRLDRHLVSELALCMSTIFLISNSIISVYPLHTTGEALVLYDLGCWIILIPGNKAAMLIVVHLPCKRDSCRVLSPRTRLLKNSSVLLLWPFLLRKELAPPVHFAAFLT